MGWVGKSKEDPPGTTKSPHSTKGQTGALDITNGLWGTIGDFWR